MRRCSAVLSAILCMVVNLMSLPLEAAVPQSAVVDAFTVIGPTVRTTNAREMSGKDGRIGPLWGQFMNGGAAAISGVIDQDTIYAVYTGYDSDETGAYDLVLGKSVQPGQQAPPAMRSVAIPKARYLVFAVTANSPEAIRSAWLKVYEYFAQHKDQRRAFSFDFEQHSSSGTRIFIALESGSR
jgi:predicted transcriptional regulator YdeE